MAKIARSKYEKMAALRYSLRKFFHFSDEAAKAIGLKPQQYQCLLAIKGAPGGEQLTIGELAEQLQVRHHSAVGLADRLVAEGLVRRIHGTADHRTVFLALTAKGERSLARLSEIHQRLWRGLAPKIDSLLREVRRRG